MGEERFSDARVFIDGNEVGNLEDVTETFDMDYPPECGSYIPFSWLRDEFSFEIMMRKKDRNLLAYGWRAKGPVRKRTLHKQHEAVSKIAFGKMEAEWLKKVQEDAGHDA